MDSAINIYHCYIFVNSVRVIFIFIISYLLPRWVQISSLILFKLFVAIPFAFYPNNYSFISYQYDHWYRTSWHITTQLINYDDVIMGTMASQITSLTIVYSTVNSGADQSNYQSSSSLAFEWGIHREPENSPHKWSVMRKMFPFDDVIMFLKLFDIVLSNTTNVPYLSCRFTFVTTWDLALRCQFSSTDIPRPS